MKKIIATLLSILLFVSPAVSQEFLSERLNEWHIFGTLGQGPYNAGCVLSKNLSPKDDMHFFALTQDLKDNELYFTVNNPKWNFKQQADAEGELTFTNKTGQSTTIAAYFQMFAPSKIGVRQIVGEKFVPLFSTLKELSIKIEKYGISETIVFDDTILGKEMMVFCIDQFMKKQEKKPKEVDT